MSCLHDNSWMPGVFIPQQWVCILLTISSVNLHPGKHIWMQPLGMSTKS